MKEEPLLEKVLHRLVEKHIAGTTMVSALEKAKKLNENNALVSITFLSDDPSDKSKARYITSTYVELVRRISRLGINASAQIPLEQIGLDMSEEIASENLSEIIKTGNRYGVFVWAEFPHMKHDVISELSKYRGVGIAFPDEHADEFLSSYRWINAAKVIFRENELKKREYYDRIVKNFRKEKGKHSTVVLSSLPEKTFRSLLKGSSEKNLIFEFRLGYSSSKMKRAVKRGAKISIFVPFGKDWIKYAMNNVPEGYMRFLAGKFLSNEKSGV